MNHLAADLLLFQKGLLNCRGPRHENRFYKASPAAPTSTRVPAGGKFQKRVTLFLQKIEVCSKLAPDRKQKLNLTGEKKQFSKFHTKMQRSLVKNGHFGESSKKLRRGVLY